MESFLSLVPFPGFSPSPADVHLLFVSPALPVPGQAPSILVQVTAGASSWGPPGLVMFPSRQPSQLLPEGSLLGRFSRAALLLRLSMPPHHL